MSDIFDMFSDEPSEPRSDSDKRVEPARATQLSPSSQAAQSDEEPAPVDGSLQLVPQLSLLLGQLAQVVADLPGSTKEFTQEPDLTMLAYAVSDLLEASGHRSGALAAEWWAQYEGSSRRVSKIAEARARANAVYTSDLEAIRHPHPPLYLTKQSNLPWRQPGDPTEELQNPDPSLEPESEPVPVLPK